jgi:hypothetical protein
MRARHLTSILAPIVLFVGCDLIPQAWDTGFSCGYGTVDALFAGMACVEEQRAERAEQQAAWVDACNAQDPAPFEEQPPLDDADRHCRDEHGFADRVVVCDDVGQEPGSHPDGCEPYNDPVIGLSDGYLCPNGVTASGVLCLCCEDEGARPACQLRDGRCRDASECCTNRCTIDTPEQVFDGGIVVPASGVCE